MLDELPRHECPVPANSIPANGIYFFFERGERLEIRDMLVDRVTRIGSHTAEGGLRSRLQTHYGNVNSLRGNKNASVFRKHVGGALMYQADHNDPRIPEWVRHGGKSTPEIEVLVSKHLREQCTFVCIEVQEKGERKVLERALISLLAQEPAGRPSESWLGHHALAPTIRSIGLWNVVSVSGQPLNHEQMDRLAALAQI